MKTSESPEELEAFVDEIIEAHNRRRRAHGAADLRHSDELDKMAQHWAERLADQAHLSYSELQGVGENITFFPKNLDPEKMVEHWYEEHEKYEYETPGWQRGTNYFTQVVWKGTEEMGVGRAFCKPNLHEFEKKYHKHHPQQQQNGNIDTPLEQVVVAFYRPAGNNNRSGQFAVNVAKPRLTGSS